MFLPTKKVLVNYSELLSRLIGAYTLYNSRSPKFFNDLDAIDILTNWDENRCDLVIKKLLANLKNGDKSINPWCVYNKSCKDCQYKVRHGLCGESSSDYALILKAVYKQQSRFRSVSSIPGLLTILHKFLEDQLIEDPSVQEVNHSIESRKRQERSWIKSLFFS